MKTMEGNIWRYKFYMFANKIPANNTVIPDISLTAPAQSPVIPPIFFIQ